MCRWYATVKNLVPRNHGKKTYLGCLGGGMGSIAREFGCWMRSMSVFFERQGDVGMGIMRSQKPSKDGRWSINRSRNMYLKIVYCLEGTRNSDVEKHLASFRWSFHRSSKKARTAWAINAIAFFLYDRSLPGGNRVSNPTTNQCVSLRVCWEGACLIQAPGISGILIPVYIFIYIYRERERDREILEYQVPGINSCYKRHEIPT